MTPLNLSVVQSDSTDPPASNSRHCSVCTHDRLMFIARRHTYIGCRRLSPASPAHCLAFPSLQLRPRPAYCPSLSSRTMSSTPAVPKTMKAIRVAHTGGPEVNKMEEVPVPTPGEGQALIKVLYTGANYIDNCESRPPPSPPPPASALDSSSWKSSAEEG